MRVTLNIQSFTVVWCARSTAAQG